MQPNEYLERLNRRHINPRENITIEVSSYNQVKKFYDDIRNIFRGSRFRDRDFDDFMRNIANRVDRSIHNRHCFDLNIGSFSDEYVMEYDMANGSSRYTQHMRRIDREMAMKYIETYPMKPSEILEIEERMNNELTKELNINQKKLLLL